MPDIVTLKKQLRGIRSTRKLTKAMKTASTVKFSKVKSIYANYSDYGRQCAVLLDEYGREYADCMGKVNEEAPSALLVVSSNRGMCGRFNADVHELALEKFGELQNCRLIACSKSAVKFFNAKKIPVYKDFAFSDVPDYAETSRLFDEIIKMRNDGAISKVYVVYSEYVNMLTQKPCVKELFCVDCERGNSVMCFPDKESFIKNTSDTVFKAMFYELVLGSAMGAQAATLMTMRSAYDTATEYCENLEAEINRIRQSAVTADVIETSAEHDE